MKMKHIYRTFLIAASLSGMVSCNLDLYPDTSLPYVENMPMIQTPEDIASYNRGIYANFRACQSGTFKIAEDVMFEAFNATTVFGNRYGAIHRLDGSFTSGDEYITSYWQSLYTSIKNYNIAIAQVPIATVDKDTYKADLDRLMADAKAARAWSYLQLARQYGKAYDPATAATDLCVPLVTVYDQAARPARASVKDIYEQIKRDLDDAYAILKDVKGERAAQTFTDDAIHSMYANYYLDIQDYGHAYEYADKVISNTQYALCSNDQEFKAEFFEDAGKEAIMLLPVSQSELAGGYGEYINYNTNDLSPTGDSYGSGYLPSKVLIDSYSSGDLRLMNWFDNCGQIPFFSNGTAYQNQFNVFVKFKGNPALNPSGVIDGHIAPKPFSLPEMYLVAVEAAFMGGSQLDALKLLNNFQEKRGAAKTQITVGDIQKEWFRETVGEGLRLDCLKRWSKRSGWDSGCAVREGQTGAVAANVLVTTTGYTDRGLDGNDYHLCWPIPSYEIRVNDNLLQNDGYTVVAE